MNVPLEKFTELSQKNSNPSVACATVNTPPPCQPNNLVAKSNIVISIVQKLYSLALLKLKGLSIFQLISLFRLIQTLRNSGRFSFNNTQNNNKSSLTIYEAYKILNLDMNKKVSKEDVNKAYIKIQKKIHPDVSPETSRLSSIVNEAKDIVLNDIS